MREAQTMRQQHHPNVLPLHCSFVHQQNLWMVMPYVAGGSVLNLMKFAYSEVNYLGCLAKLALCSSVYIVQPFCRASKSLSLPLS